MTTEARTGKLYALKKWGRPPGPAELNGDWWAPFLDSLARTGNVTASAQGAGVSRIAAYQARDLHPEFARAWDAAYEHWVDALAQEAADRGRAKSDLLLIFTLKAERPGKYREDYRAPAAPAPVVVNQQLNLILDSPEGRKLAERIVLQMQGHGNESVAALPPERAKATDSWRSQGD